MKKICLFLITVLMVIFVASCVEQEYTVSFENCNVESQTVKSGEKAVKPADPELDGSIFAGWYADKSLSETYDWEKAIEADTVIYAKWEELVQNITVVYSISQNANLADYIANKKEKVNKRTEFADLTKPYLVGDDNAWCVKPEVTFASYNPSTGGSDLIEVDEWNYEIKVILVSDREADTSEFIDSIDTKECLIDFNSTALGKEFEVQVTPCDLTEKQLARKADYTVSFTFTVVDGFNAYNALDLAYFEARESDAAGYKEWVEFKKANNIDPDERVSNIIFQSDIVLTKDDVPSYFFYSDNDISKLDADYARAIGSFKDYEYFYRHCFEEDEKGGFYGNYFTLNCEAIPEVVRESGAITAEGKCVSHSSVLFLSGSDKAEFTLDSLYLIGNAAKVENTVKAGGFLFLKEDGPKLLADNNITVCTFITYMIHYKTKEAIINNCKAYDAFNSFIYSWGCGDVKVSNCEFIGAGGPIAICDHEKPTAADGGNPPGISYTNCVLESYVVGTEGWFSVVGATEAAVMLKALDAFFNFFGKSFVKANSDGTLKYINLINVVKSADAQTLTAQKIKGSVTIDGFTFDFGANNPYLAGLLDQTFVLSAPAFESNGGNYAVNPIGGFAYTDAATGLYDVQQTQITSAENPLFSGNYITIYFNGMALTFEYFAVGQIYTPAN